MNKLKVTGLAALIAGGLTNEEWILLLSIAITVLGMIQSYLENRKK